jgi:fructosamine-3-kinase
MLGGGCINNATRLETENGPLFLKRNDDCPADMFEREAEGLAALAIVDGPRIPNVLLVGPDFILQEFIEAGARPANFWEVFGGQMAAVHNVTAPRFGFENDNYIGLTPQPNGWMEDGYAFFAERRLGYQGELARRKGLLDAGSLRLLEGLITKLPSLVPAQPGSLVHGDLWGGNVHNGPQGQPVLIDPAAHYGWAEAELAMMTLFGSPPMSFFMAYEDVRQLETGYRERFDLYNLYHLLNHLNLFGEGYAGSVRAILRKYG